MIEVCNFDAVSKQQYRSPWFELWDIKWQIWIRVGSEKEDALGLYLHMDTSRCPSQAAKFSFEMSNRFYESQSVKYVSPDEGHIFGEHNTWGYMCFANLSDLTRAESGFLIDRGFLLCITIDLVGENQAREQKMWQHERKQMGDEKKALEAQKQALEEERQKLRIEKDAWEKSAKKLQAFQSNRPIKLDVGGTVFKTSLTTLQSHKDSFFGAMMSGRWDLQLQDDGSIFIDRKAMAFQHILDFMRGEMIQFKYLSPVELEVLLADATFYQLMGLETQITIYMNLR